MKKHLAALALSASLISSAHAGEELRGFRNYLFGMSLEEVQHLIDLDRNPMDSPGLYSSKSTIHVFGADYKYIFNFKDNSLNQIILSNKTNFEETGCLLGSDLILESLRRQFGEFSQTADAKTADGKVKLLGYMRRMGDGGSVTLTVRIEPVECSIGVGFGVARDKEYY